MEIPEEIALVDCPKCALPGEMIMILALTDPAAADGEKLLYVIDCISRTHRAQIINQEEYDELLERST